MDITETTSEHIPQAEPEFILTEQMKYFLYTSGRWAYFLGIVGFVFTGFIVLAALFVGTLFSTLSQVNPQVAPFAGIGAGFISFMYLIIAVIYFFFSLYLYQFGNRIKSGISYTDSVQVTGALEKLKSFFKLWGISTIVIIGLYILILLGTIVGGIGAASMMR